MTCPRPNAGIAAPFPIVPKIELLQSEAQPGKSAFSNGLLTGLVLQIALGPVFFYIINLTIQKSLADGLAGVLGALTGDSLYIILSIVGVGSLLGKPEVKRKIGIISAVTLIIFGVVILRSAVQTVPAINGVTPTTSGVLASYLTVLVMTLSNPLTIVFFSSVFSAKAAENNYERPQLRWFGLGTAAATLIFLGLSALLISSLRAVISPLVVAGLNVLVGMLLIAYGLLRLMRSTKREPAR